MSYETLKIVGFVLLAIGLYWFHRQSQTLAHAKIVQLQAQLAKHSAVTKNLRSELAEVRRGQADTEQISQLTARLKQTQNELQQKHAECDELRVDISALERRLQNAAHMTSRLRKKAPDAK